MVRARNPRVSAGRDQLTVAKTTTNLDNAARQNVALTGRWRDRRTSCSWRHSLESVDATLVPGSLVWGVQC